MLAQLHDGPHHQLVKARLSVDSAQQERMAATQTLEAARAEQARLASEVRSSSRLRSHGPRPCPALRRLPFPALLRNP